MGRLPRQGILDQRRPEVSPRGRAERRQDGKGSDYSIVVGHGHRVEIQTITRENRSGQGENYACMFGCTCKLDGSVPAVKSSMNWQQSLGVVYYDGERTNPVPVYIHEGRAMFEGRVYSASNR